MKSIPIRHVTHDRSPYGTSATSPSMEMSTCGKAATNSPRKVLKPSPWARHLFRHPSGRSRQFSKKTKPFEPWLGSIDNWRSRRKSGYFEQSYSSRSLKRTEATGNRSLLCLIFCPKNTSRCVLIWKKRSFTLRRWWPWQP